MNDLKELLSIDVSNLKEKQVQALIDDCKCVLGEISDLLDKRDFESIIDIHLEFSGSGDEYGDENHYIKFYYGDLEETLGYIKRLQNK